MVDDLISFCPLGASFRLVFLHGWGADAEDLIPIGSVLSEVYGNKMELIYLRAPHHHSEGMGRQWYGLFPADWDSVPLEIEHLRNRLKSLSTENIPLKKTVLLGFSQGGAMAISSGCSLPLAGVIGCSAYPHPGWLPPNESPPVLLTHGNNDQVVPPSASQELIKAFESKDLDAQLFTFHGGHEIPQEVFNTLKEFLGKHLI